jgi:hypothetical protein
MFARKLFVVLVIGLLMVSMSAWAQSCASGTCTSTVNYAGQFFDDQAPTNFCARVINNGVDVYHAPLYFVGQEICSGQTYTAGFGYGGRTCSPHPLQFTDVLGRACAYETWPCGVYEVQAIAGSVGDYPGDTSCPVAVTIECENRCGIFAGGTLSLDTLIDNRGFVKRTATRDATLGFIFVASQCCIDANPCISGLPKSKPISSFVQLCPGTRTELLLIDPQGCTEIRSCDYSVWVCLSCNNKGKPKIDSAIVKGYCKFTQNGNTTTAQFVMTLTPEKKNGKGGDFDIKVTKSPLGLIYEACDEIEDGASQFELRTCVPD